MAKAKRGFTFDYIDARKPGYSKHNLSHDHLCAMGSGYLVPLWWTNTVPGDVFNINLSGFVRLLALSSPMLQREDIKVRAFKVPWRILADRKDLDKAFAGDKDGDHIDFPFMEWQYGDLNIGSLADYMGIPLPYIFDSQTKSWSKIGASYVDTLPSTNLLPVLAYHRIYHDHFRNEETENQWLDVFEQHYSTLDGILSDDLIYEFDTDAPSDLSLGSLHKVGWERDYFTAALSSSQRGSQVNIPLVGNAKIIASGNDNNAGLAGYIVNPSTKELQLAHVDKINSLDPANVTATDNFSLGVDGSSFTGIGAIALRMAMNLQAFLERNNVAGYRMIGNILAHFGVRSSNQLHDEAEYLGGISAPITISAVTQTSATENSGTPQGTQVGQGQSSFNGHLCSTRCEEPCVLMIVGYITAKSSYSQGLARKWSIRNYLDLYWPEFQTVGEQEILNKELYFDFMHGQDPEYNDGVWAYQSRFAEYKYEPDTIAGDFRTTLSYWHQSRLFTSLPAFNDAFIKANPSDRVFALDSSTYPRPYLGEFYFDIQAVRPMDKYAISKLW